ncbi:MAG: hypothetical protein ETSY1_03925 [Candidatus Entotheonella factor]|uniref:Uncharacterized protein n=1 Tax=Entotheonella factor TaxID=1429438 RepID=W4LX72_ENTF1|nr:MAG: hypothetical protein ETSY1_03925 [Candidatus Entotheonella factor]
MGSTCLNGGDIEPHRQYNRDWAHGVRVGHPRSCQPLHRVKSAKKIMSLSRIQGGRRQCHQNLDAPVKNLLDNMSPHLRLTWWQAVRAAKQWRRR